MSDPSPSDPEPRRRREVLRKLRLWVPVALASAAALCAYAASKVSGDELRGAYRRCCPGT